MKKELKEKWIAALRSGNWKQGTGVLKRLGEEHSVFCCLGVLCDIISTTAWDLLFDSKDQSYGFLDSKHADEFYSSVDLDFAQVSTLIGLNDDQRCSFGVIADYIEKYVEAA